MKKVFILIAVFVVMACRSTPSPAPDSIRLAVPYEIETLDPHARTKLSSFAVLSHFYETLVTPAADMSIKPCLAQSWQNPDVVTWLFHLQPSVRFHNGKILTAEDVAYSIQRVMDHPELETAPYVSNITEVSAVDDLTVRIKTRHPTAILLNKLSFIPIVVKGTDAKNLFEKVNGTGPYRLKKWLKDKEIHITRNETYWGKQPEIQEAIFQLGMSDAEGIKSLLSGESQFFQGYSRSSETAAIQKKQLRVVKKDSFYLKYLAFNFRSKTSADCSLPENAFQNRAIREAITIALDRSTLISSLSRYAFPVSQPVAPFTFGFNPAVQLPTYNPERARQLLQEAGLGDGFQATLHVRKMLEDAGKSVQQQLHQVGIKVRLVVLSDKDFFQTLRQREFCMFLSRFGSPTGDASDVLESAFHSFDAQRHYGILNYGLYSNAELDSAIIESSQIQQLARRKSRLQEIMAMLAEERVWVPLYGDQDLYVYDSSFSWEPRIDSLIKVWEIDVR